MKKNVSKIHLAQTIRASEKFLRYLSHRELLEWASNNSITNYDQFKNELKKIGVDLEMRIENQI